MREINFRKWFDDIGMWEMDCVEGYSVGHILSNDENISQGTGLKDKNGKEIYEGDILVRTETGKFPTEIKRVVTWNNNLAMFELGGFSLGLLLQASGKDKREYEIIGNKFENPELLNK